MLHLFMFDTGAAAGASWDLKFLRGVQKLLLQTSIEVLEISRKRRGLVVQFIPPDVVVALGVLSPPLPPLQSGGMVVVVVVMMTAAVGFAICLAFGMLCVIIPSVSIAVPVWFTGIMVVMERVIKVTSHIAHRFFRPQWGPLTFCCGAVFSHLIHKEYFRHVVDDEHLCPVRDWLGLGSTEMDVHDENGERGGSCNHCHGGDVVLSWRRGQRN